MFKHFWNQNGEKPIVPVRNHLMWLADYIDSAHFIPETELKNHPGHYILNTMHANQLLRGYAMHDHHDFENMMLDKYLFAKLDPMMWKGLKINFIKERAERLLRQLGLNNGIRFVLVNEHSQAGDVKINPETNSFVVKMDTLSGFTVLDWYLVMLYSEEIHTVSTSTFYMMQALMPDLEVCTEIFLYPRPGEDGLRGISKLNPDFKYTAMP